jgi:hypothetical protein
MISDDDFDDSSCSSSESDNGSDKELDIEAKMLKKCSKLIDNEENARMRGISQCSQQNVSYGCNQQPQNRQYQQSYQQSPQNITMSRPQPQTYGQNVSFVSRATDLSAVLSASKTHPTRLFVLMFYSKRCSVCSMFMTSYANTIYNHYGGSVYFINIDSDVQELLVYAQHFKIQKVPTFIFIKNNNVVDTYIGGDGNALIVHINNAK